MGSYDVPTPFQLLASRQWAKQTLKNPPREEKGGKRQGNKIRGKADGLSREQSIWHKIGPEVNVLSLYYWRTNSFKAIPQAYSAQKEEGAISVPTILY